MSIIRSYVIFFSFYLAFSCRNSLNFAPFGIKLLASDTKFYTLFKKWLILLFLDGGGTMWEFINQTNE